MKQLLFALLFLSAFGFAQTTCVNCGGVSSVTSAAGTTAISEPLNITTGSASAPALFNSSTGGTQTGIFFASGQVRFTNGNSFQSYAGTSGLNANVFGMDIANGDTGISRSAAGVVAFGNGTAANSSGSANLASIQYRGLAQTAFVTGDFTTSGVGTALEAITGLTWTFPATTAINARIDCNILYLQNVANVAVAFGFQDATVAPTNLAASGIQYTSATASTEGTLAASTTTTATAVTSATPSAITTIWHAQLHFLIEQPSNASTSVFTIRVSTATAADTVTIKRGSYCSLAQ